jgi:hypothetical protein
MPSYFNPTGVWPGWVRICEFLDEQYDQSKNITATKLAQPPQLVALQHRHWNQIRLNVCMEADRILGNAAHWLMARAAGPNDVAEQRMFMTIDGITIPFRPDLLVHEGDDVFSLHDGKVTKTWAVRLGGKDEWTMQLNIYAYGCRQKGMKISRLWIEFLLKDWERLGPIREPGRYPEYPLDRLEVEDWGSETTEKIIRNRLSLHSKVADIPDVQLPECTISERWGTQARWAVVGASGKALPKKANFSSREEAEAAARVSTKPNAVEFRPGENKRCEHYCTVRDFCHQYQKLIQQAPI